MSNGNGSIRKDNIATIHATLDAGITFLNTVDFYGSGQSKKVIGEAIKGNDRDKLYVILFRAK